MVSNMNCFTPPLTCALVLHLIIIGTTEIEDLRLLQCHALPILTMFRSSIVPPASGLILSKYLVLFFDCLTLKMEVLRFSEAPVAIYQSTERDTAQEMNINERTPLRETRISQTL